MRLVTRSAWIRLAVGGSALLVLSPWLLSGILALGTPCTACLGAQELDAAGRTGVLVVVDPDLELDRVPLLADGSRVFDRRRIEVRWGDLGRGGLRVSLADGAQASGGHRVTLLFDGNDGEPRARFSIFHEGAELRGNVVGRVAVSRTDWAAPGPFRCRFEVLVDEPTWNGVRRACLHGFFALER